MQDINLYQPVSKGVRGALSAQSTGGILLAVSATLLGIWGFAQWQLSRLRTEIEVVRRQQTAQAAMSAAQGPQLDALSQEELDALVARLTASVDTKTRALDQLRAETAAQPAGFSTRLSALARRHTEGIWLERLTLGATNDSISISGSTLSADFVPRYLRSLASDPALNGGQIDDFIIEKPDPEKARSQGGRLSFRAGKRDMAVAAVDPEIS